MNAVLSDGTLREESRAPRPSKRAIRKSRSHEAHLTIRAVNLPPGAEWAFGQPGWTVALVGRGNGYCLTSKGHVELPTGSMLVVFGPAPWAIRSSQLGELSLRTFSILPTRLPGLITVGEQEFLKASANNSTGFIRFEPESPLACRLKELCSDPNQPAGLLLRLQLLQVFVEALGGELQAASQPQVSDDARKRLQDLLQTVSPGELAEMSLCELARRAGCTSRHASRIFSELTGMSFLEKRSEIRMNFARELLAGGTSKVVDVALESGYKSLSLFNQTFSRRFGVSPGVWRKKNGASAQMASPRSLKFSGTTRS